MNERCLDLKESATSKKKTRTGQESKKCSQSSRGGCQFLKTKDKSGSERMMETILTEPLDIEVIVNQFD